MASSEKTDERRILTPEFRVSYPHVFKAAQVMGKGAAKFSVTMLFEKKKDLSVIKLAIKHAKIQKYGPNQKDWPTDLVNPVSDGDDPKFADKEGYAGHWVIKAASNEENRPGVVDENVKPILDASQFYPGCFARAQVFAHAWEFMGKEGICFILDHIQKTRDGKSFGGKKAAAEVFSPLASSAEDGEEAGASDSFM